MRAFVVAFAIAGMPSLAQAAALDGASLGLAWALPFAGILLSIALFPLVAHHFWEKHHGKVAALWAVAIIVPLALSGGPMMAVEALVHTALLEYIPFILLLTALFTVAGGIVISGNLHGSPGTNTAILAIGAAQGAAPSTNK